MKKINGILILFCFFACGKDNGINQKEIIESSIDFPPDSTYNIGFLIMDGTYNTELTAPFDIFQHTIFREDIKPMSVFTISKDQSYIKTFEGLEIKVDYRFLLDSVPPIDILVIPSAEHHLDTDLEDELIIAKVRSWSKDAMYVTSHCDGAFVLAQAGLLDGINCTTFPSDITQFRQRFDKPLVHENVWFVHDGKFITSAGGARSFEAALYVCDLLYGEAVTQRLASGLVLDYNLKAIPHKVF